MRARAHLTAQQAPGSLSWGGGGLLSETSLMSLQPLSREPRPGQDLASGEGSQRGRPGAWAAAGGTPLTLLSSFLNS